VDIILDELKERALDVATQLVVSQAGAKRIPHYK
jgi:hypothetical protein